MPPTVVLAVILAVALAIEAVAFLGWLAATASGRGAEGALGFAAAVLVLVHAGRFVGGALRRSGAARETAARRSLAVAAIAAAAFLVRNLADPEAVSRTAAIALAAGLVAPLAAIAVLLRARGARAWFGAADGPQR